MRKATLLISTLAVGAGSLLGVSGDSFIAINGADISWTNWKSYRGTTIGRASLNGTGVDQRFVTGALGPFGIALTG